MSDEFGGGRFNETTKRIYQDGKVGGSAGWTVRAAANTWMSTVAASQSGAKLVIPLTGLEIGDKLVGGHLVGQIDSAGNQVDITHEIYEFDAAAAGSAASAKSGTSKTLSVTADTELKESNTFKGYADANQVVVQDGKTYFALLTATTLGSTDIELLAFVLHLKKRG